MKRLINRHCKNMRKNREKIQFFLTIKIKINFNKLDKDI